MNITDDMGFVYVAEQTTPEDMKISNLKVTDKGHVFFVEFDSGLHSFEIINRNERQYLRSNIEECITSSEKIQSLLADNAWYGEMDHPMVKKAGEKLSPQRIQNVWMPNRSHKIMKPRFEGNMLFATIQTSSGTEAGRGFANEIIQGLHPSFSCRALAALKLINGKPTVIVRKIITYDWVLYPSHKEAHINGTAHGVVKDIQAVTESALEKGKTFIKNKSEDILLPLKEILESVGRKDVNTQIIMESFNLDSDDLIGIDPTKKYALIADENNVIYSRMNPETVKEVHEFYNSFNL